MKSLSNINIFHSPIASKRQYRVETSYWLDGELKTRFHYQILINCIKRLGNNRWLYELEKKQLFVNNKAPELMVDKLAQDCASILYPLRITVSSVKNKIVVQNISNILKRWDEKRPYLERYYIDELSKKYLQLHENNINKPSYINRAIRQNLFYTTFFYPIHHKYKRQSAEQTIFIPLLPFCPHLRYNVEYEIQETPAEAETFSIKQMGKLADMRTVTELLAKLPEPLKVPKDRIPLEGSLNAEYILYKKRGLISNLNGEYSLQMPYGKEVVKIAIKHLSEKDHPSSKGLTYWDEKEEKKKHQFFVEEKT